MNENCMKCLPSSSYLSFFKITIIVVKTTTIIVISKEDSYSVAYLVSIIALALSFMAPLYAAIYFFVVSYYELYTTLMICFRHPGLLTSLTVV